MTTELDAMQGHAVGAKIRMYGRMLGIDLSLEEVVTERQPPFKKTWETIGTPRLVIIGRYRMGFELAPQDDSSLLRVFIDYALPDTAPGRWLVRLLAGVYARWCTNRMAADAARHFAPLV